MSWSLNCKGRCGNAFQAYLNLSGKPQAMDQTKAIWIKDPLAILADGAERGIVVRNGKIVELVPKGGQPTTSAAFFGADQHPSPFLSDADASAAGGAGPRIVSLAADALPGVGAADASSPRPRRHR